MHFPEEQYCSRQQEGAHGTAQPQPGKEGGSHGQRRQTCAGPQQPGFQEGAEQFGQGKQ